mgnify:FL=1
MNSEIPLIKDLNDTFSDNNIESIFDVKIINMYNNFNNKKDIKYTNDEIYNYIKFINITCMDSKYY